MKFTDLYPELGKKPLPVEPMVSPTIFEQERQHLFKQTWLKVARVEEIAKSGDYKIKRINIAQTSVIIVRGKDGAIRAFHNICTHRGNKVLPETDNETFGNARAHVLTCRFHGWVFGTDGTLRSVPMQEKFEGLDRACYGLQPVHCDVWEGFVFICLADEPVQDLLSFLGGMATHFGGYPYAESTYTRRYSTVLKCNWKIALYAFTEGYHVQTIHAGTLPGLATLQHQEFKLFGPHSTSTLYVPPLEGTGPTPATAALGGLLWGSHAHGPRLNELPAGINPDRRNDFQFEFPTVFPNFLIHLASGNGYPGMTYFTHQFWPISVGETLWEGINYFRPPETLAELVAIAHINALHRNAWLEDTSTMEDTYSALQSGVLSEMVLMDEELMIRNTSHHINKYLSSGTS